MRQRDDNTPDERAKENKAVTGRENDANVTDDPLLSLSGSGRDLWSDEHADEYVRRLREE